MRNPFPDARLRAESRDSLSDERFDKLRREFDQIDSNRDAHLSYQEIHEFLSKRSGRAFDKNLCQELFAKMDKNEDDAITVDEFIRAYVEAEDMIKGRMEDLKEQIRQSTIHLNESKKQLQEAAESEEMNEFGIMKGSQLTVQVIEAKNLKQVGIGGSSNPFVILTCGTQKIETRKVNRSQTPKWDEAFTFNIHKGDIDLKAVVESEGMLKMSSFQGQVSIPLTLVKDQMKHDSWFELHGPKGNEPWQGQLRLGIQWIWSRKEYLAAIVKQWEDNINLDHQEIEHLQMQLKKLDAPFGFVDIPETTTFGKVTVNVQMGQVENILDDKIGELAAKMVGADFNWQLAALISIGVLIGLGVFSMYIRPDFPNVTSTQLLLGVVSFLFFVSKTITSRHYKYLCYCILGLGLYDLLWFGINGDHWSAGITSVDNELTTVRHFSLWISAINSVVKLVVLLVFWKNALEMQKVEAQPI